MGKLNAINTLKAYAGTGRKNPHYDLKASDLFEIKNYSKGEFEVITNFFTFGYAQGYKAALAELRK